MSRIAELEKKVTEILEQAISEGELPCGNVMVLHKDKVVCYAQAGKDPGTGKEIQRDTIFRLYSQSKPITSAAVCLLMERGILEMNEPVEKYLPGFANARVLQADGTTVPANRPVKLMDLMGMCAGLCYPMVGAVVDGLAAEVQILGRGEQFQFHAINNVSARYLLHEY